MSIPACSPSRRDSRRKAATRSGELVRACARRPPRPSPGSPRPIYASDAGPIFASRLGVKVGSAAKNPGKAPVRSGSRSLRIATERPTSSALSDAAAPVVAAVSMNVSIGAAPRGPNSARAPSGET